MADPQQVDLLRQGVEVWNQYAKTVDKIDLSGANLRGADMFRANLIGAGLRGADLFQAKLVGAVLRRADLLEANLSGADLTLANLLQANLRGADMVAADLGRANLLEADLRGAALNGAELRGARLSGADLNYAYLRQADCRTVINDKGERAFTDLGEAIGLTQEQLDEMTGDRGVIIPTHLTYPEHWPELPGEAAVPAYTEEPFVFISYDHANKAEVAEIVHYFRAHNINIWWDDDIAPGDKWRDQITDKLAECQAVLTLWTEQSVKSRNVIEEAEVGKHGDKLLHARLDSAPLPYGFGEVQYADLTHWDRRSGTLESSRLLAALKQKLDLDDANLKQQLQEAISDPKLGDIAAPEVTEYFKDLDADLKDSLSQPHLDAAQDDRRHRQIKRGLVDLAKAAVGFIIAVAAGLTAAVIIDPTAAHHVLAQFNAILDKLLKIFN